jgi:hypothetical protein
MLLLAIGAAQSSFVGRRASPLARPLAQLGAGPQVSRGRAQPLLGSRVRPRMVVARRPGNGCAAPSRRHLGAAHATEPASRGPHLRLESSTLEATTMEAPRRRPSATGERRLDMSISRAGPGRKNPGFSGRENRAHDCPMGLVGPQFLNQTQVGSGPGLGGPPAHFTL